MLALDAGNSALKAALFEGEAVATERFPWSEDWQVAFGRWMQRHPRPVAAGLASVVPARTAALHAVLAQASWPVPLALNADLPLPLRLAYATPHTLGADRIAAAVGAWSRVQGPVVALDAGTALTYEVVTGGAVYLGGAIAPGPELLLRSLHAGTARLPAVPFALPSSPIGNSTTAALQAGTAYGCLDAVRGMLARIEVALGTRPRVLATGGYGAWLAEHVDRIDEVRPLLVLEGVRDAVAWQHR